MDTRIIKIVEISASLPASYGYARKRLRVVRCQPNQKGYRNEKDVDVIWESYHFAANSKGPKSDYQKYLAKAEAIKLEHEMPEIGYSEINGSPLVSVWMHSSPEFSGWIVCQTQDGKYWLDTDPSGCENVSDLSDREAVMMRGKQIIEDGRNIILNASSV
jgi:hypothetical protein